MVDISRQNNHQAACELCEQADSALAGCPDFQSALTASPTLAQSILQTTPCRVAVVDEQRQLVLINNSFCRMIGKSSPQLLGRTLEEVLPAPGLAEKIRKVTATGQNLGQEELQLPDQKGGHRIYRLGAFTIQSASTQTDPGNQKRILLLADDITDQKNTEAELIRQRSIAEKANRLKTEFLANMSHEIRTPMNGIIGFADLLAAEQLPQQQQEWVNTIRNCGRDLLAIIDDILDISRIEANQLGIEPCQFAVSDVLSDVMQTMAPWVESAGLSVSLHCAEDTPQSMNSDPQRLRQILSNLLTNAVKFTDRGGVTVTVSPDHLGSKPAVRFNVTDTGIGIAKEHHQVIFDIFKQVDNSVSRKYGGSGLGLAICKRLASLLGGTITVQSELGKGSTFSVVLPLEAPVVADTDLAGSPPVKSAGSLQHPASSLGDEHSLRAEGILQLQGKILLVEDNPVNRNLFKIVLERAGLQVEQATDGRTALDMACRKGYDLILMDVQIPELDGLEVTRILRNQGQTTPIIALTAHAMSHDPQICLQAGCDAYLAKPLSHGELLAAIQEQLAKTRPAQAAMQSS